MTDEDKLQDQSRASSAPPDTHPHTARKHAIRKGGVQPGGNDPLGEAPLAEPYAARSGEHPGADGTAKDVTQPTEPPRGRER